MEIFLFLLGEALVTSQAVLSLSPKGQDPLFPLLQAVTICGWIKSAVASLIMLQQDFFSPIDFVSVIQEKDAWWDHSLADTWELIILEQQQQKILQQQKKTTTKKPNQLTNQPTKPPTTLNKNTHTHTQNPTPKKTPNPSQNKETSKKNPNLLPVKINDKVETRLWEGLATAPLLQG